VSKSISGARMDEIASGVSPLLRERGFRKQGRTFTRDAGEGILHVIHFQTGLYVSSLYGNFTAEVAVFVPEIHRIMIAGATSPRRPKPWDCEIRRRIGFLTPDQCDRWWDLGPDTAGTVREMRTILREHAIPYLDRLPDRSAIRRQYDEDPKVLFRLDTNRHRLAIAAVWAATGDTERARRLMLEECARDPSNACRVVEMAARIGIDLPTHGSTIAG
jgi:hypothetical protein